MQLAWHLLGPWSYSTLSGLVGNCIWPWLCAKSADKHLPFPPAQALNKFSMNHLGTKGDSGRANSQALLSVLVYMFLENWCGHTPDRCWNRLALSWTVIGSGDIACFWPVYPQGYVVVLPTWDKSPKWNIRIHTRPLNCPLSSSTITGTERGVSFLYFSYIVFSLLIPAKT